MSKESSGSHGILKKESKSGTWGTQTLTSSWCLITQIRYVLSSILSWKYILNEKAQLADILVSTYQVTQLTSYGYVRLIKQNLIKLHISEKVSLSIQDKLDCPILTLFCSLMRTPLRNPHSQSGRNASKVSQIEQYSY